MNRKAHFKDVEPMDSKRMLVLSLGTGTTSMDAPKYDAVKASNWSMLDWLSHQGSIPILDACSQASSDLVDFHVSALFKSSGCNENYLRIQVYEGPNFFQNLNHTSPPYNHFIHVLELF